MGRVGLGVCCTVGLCLVWQGSLLRTGSGRHEGLRRSAWASWGPGRMLAVCLVLLGKLVFRVYWVKVPNIRPIPHSQTGEQLPLMCLT